MPAEYEIPSEGRRERTVSWHDPIHAAPLGNGLSGLELMRGIRDGTLPAPPMARLIGFRCVTAEPGEIAMSLHYDPSLENLMGMAHGGVAATMLDTAMGCAASTVLPTGSGVVTLDLNITYLRPVTARQTPVVATARVINLGRRIVYVGGEVRSSDDTLVAHAVGNFSIVGPSIRTSFPETQATG